MSFAQDSRDLGAAGLLGATSAYLTPLGLKKAAPSYMELGRLKLISNPDVQTLLRKQLGNKEAGQLIELAKTSPLKFKWQLYNIAKSQGNESGVLSAIFDESLRKKFKDPIGTLVTYSDPEEIIPPKKFDKLSLKQLISKYLLGSEANHGYVIGADGQKKIFSPDVGPMDFGSRNRFNSPDDFSPFELGLSPRKELKEKSLVNRLLRGRRKFMEDYRAGQKGSYIKPPKYMVERQLNDRIDKILGKNKFSYELFDDIGLREIFHPNYTRIKDKKTLFGLFGQLVGSTARRLKDPIENNTLNVAGVKIKLPDFIDLDKNRSWLRRFITKNSNKYWPSMLGKKYYKSSLKGNPCVGDVCTSAAVRTAEAIAGEKIKGISSTAASPMDIHRLAGKNPDYYVSSFNLGKALRDPKTLAKNFIGKIGPAGIPAALGLGALAGAGYFGRKVWNRNQEASKDLVVNYANQKANKFLNRQNNLA